MLTLYIFILWQLGLFLTIKLLYNRRKMTVGWTLSKMANLLWKTYFLITLISCIPATDGANILGIFPMPSMSHMTVHSSLLKELARRGHRVTVFSPFPEQSPIPNYTDIEFKLSYHELRQITGEHNT